MNGESEYDVALSFAGEDRSHAKSLADELRKRGLKVFYDEYEKTTLFGEDLYAHLSDVYQKRARFVVMLLSQHYAQKLWTNHERKAAQARAFSERRAYILPVRLDDTEIDGVLPTTGYLRIPPESSSSLADAIEEKLAAADIEESVDSPSAAARHRRFGWGPRQTVFTAIVVLVLLALPVGVVIRNANLSAAPQLLSIQPGDFEIFQLGEGGNTVDTKWTMTISASNIGSRGAAIQRGRIEITHEDRVLLTGHLIMPNGVQELSPRSTKHCTFDVKIEQWSKEMQNIVNRFVDERTARDTVIYIHEMPTKSGPVPLWQLTVSITFLDDRGERDTQSISQTLNLPVTFGIKASD